jgi:prepilin-type N-terminal cleavage/methylation domain-containing protein
MKRNQQGFTLVEIAIVLVIIGLLLGGILKGQEMITQAKIKNAITDFSGVSAAYFGYQDRYRATPGDDNQATRWGAAVISGDGNRVLVGTYKEACPATAVAATPESCLWWEHLRRSGFVSGAGPQQPNNAFNGLLGVQTGDGAAAPVAVLANSTGGFTNIIMCSSNLPDKVAIALDVQMDDGLLAGGAVRGQLNASANPTIAATVAATDVYAETGTNLYTLCRQF